MPNKQRGIAVLAIGDKTFNLQLNLDALAEVEDRLKLDNLMDIQAAMNPPKAKNIKVILAAMIMAGEGIFMEDALTIAGRVDMTTLMKLPESLGTIIEMSMDDGEDHPPAEAAPTATPESGSR